jgi:hypothetical protein
LGCQQPSIPVLADFVEKVVDDLWEQ